jgi:RNA polymerase sigma-70 factor (family 1)
VPEKQYTSSGMRRLNIAVMLVGLALLPFLIIRLICTFHISGNPARLPALNCTDLSFFIFQNGFAMKTSERTLVDLLQKGDYRAFGELFYKYQHRLLHYSTYLLKDADAAENVVQDSFIRLWEVRQRLNPEKSVEAYLFKIIRNKAFDYLKRLEKDYELQAELKSHTWERHVVQTLPEEHISFSMETVMQLLPPRRRKIISLIIEQGKSHKEVAREMKISVSTVKNQMVQAKKYLQHKINPTAFYE